MKIIKVLLFKVLFLSVHIVVGQVKLPQLVSDGMVLQRNQPIKIWGWASPLEKVGVTFNKREYKTVTDDAGNWSVQIPSTKAGGPYSLKIDASNHIILNNIIFGDVWFCAGQSNMVTPMERVKELYPNDIANATYPEIRNFFVSTVADVTQEHNDLPVGRWISASPESVLDFGAVSYFMARQLYNKYRVPIGIINSSVGGTPIQAWISASGIKSLPTYTARLALFKDTAFMSKLIKPAKQAFTARAEIKDEGLLGPVKWFETSFVPHEWRKFWLPGYWADQGVRNLNGTVWFRKEIIVPESMVGKQAKLFLGRIVDADETYVNGVKVGNITYQYPPRRYDVPAGLLKAGKNIIVVRLTNTSGKGGFVPDKRYELTDGKTSIDLRGDWLYKVGEVITPLKRPTGDIESGLPFSAQNEPTGLYNTMVHPAVNYCIKGFVWYQGETNTNRPKEYRQLLPALIADWRNKWNNNNLPFLYVQLPNFMEVQYSPSESQWAELREAQLKTLSVPNTAMAVAIDAGEWNDIHPLNKKDIGERLGLAAQKLAYGDKKVVGSGPIFQSAKIEGNRIIITFNSIGSGLIAKGSNNLAQFAIAGVDKQFVWGDAKINGDHVIVTSAQINNPLYVRYAWADNPEGANLYNKEGLPASPFRTDE
jgi:sialate O-acetylesterase